MRFKAACKWTQKNRGAQLTAEAKKIKVGKAATAVLNCSTGWRSTTDYSFGNGEHLEWQADARSLPVARHLPPPRTHRLPKRYQIAGDPQQTGSDEHLKRHAHARSLPVARYLSRPRIHRQ